MNDQALIRKILANELEDSMVQYKQMELDSLLEVTKSINLNSSAENLFKIYGFILQAQMKVNRLAVMYLEDGEWICKHKIDVEDVDQSFLKFDESWLKYQETVFLKDTNLPLKEHFDILLPVYHKERPLSFVLIGKLKEYMDLEDSQTNRMNFIQTITNIIVVAIENKRLFNQQLAQVSFEREMELAAKVQNMLIPNQLPQNEYLNIDAIYMPHFNIGGDYYDVFPVSEDELLVCMADVSGKGISAALLMANFQAMLRVLAKESDLSLTHLIQKLNSGVEEITKGDRFLTFFVARYNLKTRVLEYVNAGHPPPVLFQNGKAEDLVRLDKGTTIIGAFKELPKLQLGKVENLASDSKLIIFTDGLTDLENQNGEFFEEENIIDFISKQNTTSSSSFNEALLNDINEFRGETVFTDDISVISIHFH